eukprot:m.195022 g.195022  ORF g.195022 m.195022 type:complete len:55 (+) comp15686_c0_seq6:53-217(+)
MNLNFYNNLNREKVSMSAMLQNDVTSVMDTTKADCIINNDGLCTITFKGSAREL